MDGQRKGNGPWIHYRFPISGCSCCTREALTPELAQEIRQAIQDPNCNGYHLGLQMFFLGRRLRHCGASFWKLSLFRRGKGRFECRLKDQDASMADMEVHEHVVVSSETACEENSSTKIVTCGFLTNPPSSSRFSISF